MTEIHFVVIGSIKENQRRDDLPGRCYYQSFLVFLKFFLKIFVMLVLIVHSIHVLGHVAEEEEVSK